MTYLVVQAGQLEFRVETTEPQNLFFAILDEDGTTVLTCRRADSNLAIGHHVPVGGFPFYSQKPQPGSAALIRLSMVGIWRLPVFGEKPNKSNYG